MYGESLLINMSNISRSRSNSSILDNCTIRMSEMMVDKAETLCRAHVPSLSTCVGIKTFQDRGRVYVFVTSKGVWYKLRIFKIDWLNVSVNPFSKIEFVEVKDLSEHSLFSVISKDCMTIESAKELSDIWVETFRK